MPIHTTESVMADCPFSKEQMSRYMKDCHYHHMTQETPTTFEKFEFRERFVFQIREFWVWECEDGFGRTWDITVGRGKSPFFEETSELVWMHATLYSKRYSPREIVVSDFPEHENEAQGLH